MLKLDRGDVIVVTGAHGFLGHHVVAELKRHLGDNPDGIVIQTPTHEELDLMDPNALALYFMEFEPDVIIHLAAQCGGIGANRERPGEFLFNNMMMTSNLIEYCRLYGIKKFVGVGTVCSYPKHTPVPFVEEDLYNGYPEETNAPYGIAKRVQLEMLKAYRTQYGMNSVFLIPVNMVGEWDNFNDASSHVVPAMMKKFHRAKLSGATEVELWGDGSASREFLYAGDCARAIVQAMMLYDETDPVNIGTGTEITIKELAELMRSIVGFDGQIRWLTDMPNGQPRRCLDVTKAEARFGFTAQAKLEDVLESTYKWAQENGKL